MKSMNSQNHAKAGQNALYNDGHVVWWNNPFAGISHDNIYNPPGDTANKRLASWKIRHRAAAMFL